MYMCARMVGKFVEMSYNMYIHDIREKMCMIVEEYVSDKNE
jgi:hypothetical protein